MSAPWPNPRMPFTLASDRPALAPPQPGKGLIVNVVLNVEHWPFDQPMPRSILPPPHGKPPTPPDIPTHAWVDYGLRAGMPRLLSMLGERGVPISALTNASIVESFPRLAERMLEAGCQFLGHCWVQRSLKTLGEAEEAEIANSLAALRRFSGQPVRGWLGPGFAETERTPELLRKHGVLFLHDWTVDDLPVWMRTNEGPMLAMPYALDLNDVVIYGVQAGASGEWRARVEASLATLGPEAARQPRVLTLSLHPHIAGVPHVAAQLAGILDLLLARDDTCFLTTEEIGEWYMTADPAGVEAVA